MKHFLQRFSILNGRSIHDFGKGARPIKWRIWLVCSILVVSTLSIAELLPADTKEINPSFEAVGTIWNLVLALGCLALAVLPGNAGGSYLVVTPFIPFFGWALCCWIYQGCDIPGLKSLASSVTPFFFVVGLTKTVKVDRGLKIVIGSLTAGLLLSLVGAVTLGLLGFQPMFGDTLGPYSLSRLVGVGRSSPTVNCALILLAVMVARHLASPRKSSYVWAAALLAIPALAVRRMYFLTACCIVLGASVWGLILALRRKPLSLNSTVRRSASIHRVSACLGLLLLLCGVTLLALPTVINKSFTDRGEFTASGRENLWPWYLHVALDNPVFGVGPHGDHRIVVERAWFSIGAPHNEFLMLSVCYGLPGLFLWVVGMCFLFVRVYKTPCFSYNQMICRFATLLLLLAMPLLMVTGNIIRNLSIMNQFLALPALCLGNTVNTLKRR